eukprot:10227182-Karenia_brevis.AAC.1
MTLLYPPYKKRLQVDMKESRSSTVVIEDAAPDAVEAMLAYLYTGAIGDYPNTPALLQVAHPIPTGSDHSAILGFDCTQDHVAQSFSPEAYDCMQTNANKFIVGKRDSRMDAWTHASQDHVLAWGQAYVWNVSKQCPFMLEKRIDGADLHVLVSSSSSRN